MYSSLVGPKINHQESQNSNYTLDFTYGPLYSVIAELGAESNNAHGIAGHRCPVILPLKPGEVFPLTAGQARAVPQHSATGSQPHRAAGV